MSSRLEHALPHTRQLCIRMIIAVVIVGLAPSVFYADVNAYFDKARDIGFDNLPYKNFLWEYPPLAAIPLALVPLTFHVHDLFFVCLVATMVVVEYLCLLRLRAVDPGRSRELTRFWWLSVVPLATIGWFRLDFLAVAAATFAVIAVIQNRRYVLATFAGFGIKLWPLVFGVSMLLQRRWRDGFLTAGACIALLGVWYLFSPDGLETFLDYRSGSGFQVESIPGSLLLLAGRQPELLYGAVVVGDEGYHWVQIVLQMVFVATPLAVLVCAWRRKVNMVALLGGLVCVMLLSTRLLSPQFLLWLAPFVALLWPTMKRVGLVYMAAAWTTVIVIWFYEAYLSANVAVGSILIIRNALLVWLAVELLMRAFKAPSTTSEAATSSAR